MKGLGRGRVRSTEVAKVFGASFGRPDGFGSSDFAQIVDVFMLYPSIWVTGADYGQKLGIHWVSGADYEQTLGIHWVLGADFGQK